MRDVTPTMKLDFGSFGILGTNGTPRDSLPSCYADNTSFLFFFDFSLPLKAPFCS